MQTTPPFLASCPKNAPKQICMRSGVRNMFFCCHGSTGEMFCWFCLARLLHLRLDRGWAIVHSSRKQSQPLPYFWEKESIYHPAPVRNFSLPKKGGSLRKDFGGRYGFPGFYRAGWKVSLRPENVPPKYSFGGGRVHFFLLCTLQRSWSTALLP